MSQGLQIRPSRRDVLTLHQFDVETYGSIATNIFLCIVAHVQIHDEVGEFDVVNEVLALLSPQDWSKILDLTLGVELTESVLELLHNLCLKEPKGRVRLGD